MPGDLDAWLIGGVALLVAFLAGTASTMRRKPSEGISTPPAPTPTPDGLTAAATTNTDEAHAAEVEAVTDAATGSDSARVLAEMLNAARRKR